jgi:tetratricopeptide (TPR) repeat protein
MKNNITIMISLLLLLTMFSCDNKVNTLNTANSQSNVKVDFDPLKERNPQLAQAADWADIKSKATELKRKIDLDPKDSKSKLLLAQLYMKEARITGEHPYYYPATLKILDNILQTDSVQFEAMAFKASVLLSLHHFQEALEVGNKAKAINGNNGFIYGVLCDANVELGNYEEAVKMSDKMQSVRPGLESYSRASYLREIHGNNQAAIEALKMAFQAALPGTEEASWVGNTLGQLLLKTGDLQHAEEISNIVLEQRPSYAFSTNTLGEIAMAKKNYKEAIKLFDEAIQRMPEVSFYENKAEALENSGDTEGAKKIYQEVITMMEQDAKSGHYVDMEQAMVYLRMGNNEAALKRAQIEYDRRPMNIDVNHTLAWVLFKSGKTSEAKKYMDVAMRTGKQNALLLNRAAQIEKALGNNAKSAELSSKSKKINTFM